MSHRSPQPLPPAGEQADSPCPCRTDATRYADCCQPFHLGTAKPPTAEQLMRSRYSAYCLHLTDYLVETTHPTRRPNDLKARLEDGIGEVEWRSLEILGTSNGGEGDKVGKVEFVARYSAGGDLHRLHERSRFRRFKGAWSYFDDRG